MAVAHTKAAGETSVARGEAEIAPEEVSGTLTGKSAGSAGAGGGGGGGGGATPDEETASIVAQEKSQAELDAAADQGAADMESEQQDHDSEAEAERVRTMEEVEQTEEGTASDQRSEKSAAQRFSQKKRGEWRNEQSDAAEKSDTDSEKAETNANTEIKAEQTTRESEAEKHLEGAQRNAKKEKANKEAEAAAEKAKEKKSSGGFFGWAKRKAKALFNKIKAAIKSIMKALRDVVKGLIDAAKKLAVAAIEAARVVAVAAIRVAGEAVKLAGDVALAAFPEARERFHKYIDEKVADAEDAVNELADDLKKGVTALLDALGDFLDKALALLEKALLAVVEAYEKAVDAIISAAEAVAKAFGLFMAIIKDIAKGPGAWIGKLGASVVDGIKNHLVKAMKEAISAWFKGKVEEVLGLPIDLMKALIKGGINLGAMATIAWSALKTAIPGILIQLLIETLAKMIVPAVGAVLAVIEGLQAAWGTVSKIIAAIDKFIAFLKAVKSGSAGPQFATAAAAGAVIDFVANWLLERLMKPAKKVSGKLAAMAKKIMAKLKKGFKKIGKKLKKAFKKAVKKVKGFFKKKKGKKGKKKDKGKRKEDDPDKKKKAAERKRKKAQAKIKRKLAKGLPEAKAGGAIRSIAASFGAKASFNFGAKRWSGQLSINPVVPLSGEVEEEPKLDEKKLQQAKQGADNVEAGAARELEVIEALKERAETDGGQVLPTRPTNPETKKQKRGGIDTAFFREGKTENESSLEIVEVKNAGGDVKIESQKASNKGGEIENKISAITDNLERNIDDMYSAIAQAASDPKAAAATKQKLQRILSGKGGMLRIVLDIRASASISDKNARKLKRRVRAALKRLMGKPLRDVKTQIDFVLRKEGEHDKPLVKS